MKPEDQARAEAESMDLAVREAGGADELRGLIADAKTFLPPAEVPGMNDLLADPTYRQEGVRLLLKLRQEHRTNPRTENHDPMTDRAAFRDLEQRAMSGDEAAWRQYAAINVSQLKWT